MNLGRRRGSIARSLDFCKGAHQLNQSVKILPQAIVGSCKTRKQFFSQILVTLLSPTRQGNSFNMRRRKPMYACEDELHVKQVSSLFPLTHHYKPSTSANELHNFSSRLVFRDKQGNPCSNRNEVLSHF